MSEKEEKNTTSTKLNGFLEKNRKYVFAFSSVLIVLLIGFLVFEVVKSTTTNKNLAAIDSVFYQMTQGSDQLDDVELESKRVEFIEKLTPYAAKGGIVGVRANLICAELSFQKKDYANAITYWNNAETKGKKLYTAPIASFNKGVCYEQLGNLDEAANAYKVAADFEDYVMKNHAKFSYGRVLETQGKYADAAAAYTELNDNSPDDRWAQLAKTRLIALSVENKIQ